MGAERRVPLSGTVPTWPAVAEAMARAGLPLQMRMIDGELAFPDEAPPEGWCELRVAHGGAMVTVRRAPGEVVLVVWGNADEAQRRLQEALAVAFTDRTS
ncbi:MAG: hypothetical protein U0797_22350 [Gemmataceae bacterium]